MNEELDKELSDEEDKRLTKAKKKQQRRAEKEERRRKERQRRRTKRFLLWAVTAAIVIAIIGGITWRAKSSNDGGSASGLVLNEVNEGDHLLGNREASVTLVEYSDFQCPACASFHSTVKRLAEEFGDNIRIVYRHYPIRQSHPNAQLAAQAAEAAGHQGKFWEMHDVLYERQDEWSKERDPKDTFIRYAEELSLNVEQFEEVIDSGEVKDKIDEDYRSGVKAKVNSTPSFFLNGEIIANPRSYDEFKEIVEKAIGEDS